MKKVFLCLSAIALLGCVHFAFKASGKTLPRAPIPEQYVGAWVGFDQDSVNFYRLELDENRSGYLAKSLPRNPSEVDVYKIVKWDINGFGMAIEFAPHGDTPEPIYLTNKTALVSLVAIDFEVGGTRNRWTRSARLYREADFAWRNSNALNAIKQRRTP
ncbi:MAG: hypothetical protein AB1705_16060 [Verrucomicrobiota bacterium]